MDIRKVKFQCSDEDCGAEDFVKLFEGEKAPMVINCWKCHAGYGKDVGEMLGRQTGMFPVPEETAA